MNQEALKEIAVQMVAKGKGLLAADESISTAGKRLESIGLESTEETRRLYRDLFLTASGIEQYLSGVIFYDETLRQNASDGRSFVKLLQDKGIIPGIKVDQGAKDFDGHTGEKVTDGLEGLAGRVKEYHALGARFAKWRGVITIGEGIPTDDCIEENANRLAEYARICQEGALVPIVEPEVLLEGTHGIERAEEVTTKTLQVLFAKIAERGVYLPGLILKSSMVVPGNKSGEEMDPEAIAEATVRTFQNTLPKELAGVVFLSGGQTSEQATVNLNAIAKRGPLPWTLTFSFARALQGPSLEIWKGKLENIQVAQEKFLERLKETVEATAGKYTE